MVDVTRDLEDEEGTEIDRRSLSARLALIAFCVVEVGAATLYFSLAHRQWFFADEWVFLAGRRAGDVLQPYGGHWTALPLLAYRALYSTVGLRSYTPYLAMTIALQVTNAALLRVVMRRAGVGPWIATAAASLFVLFGSGAQDVLWAFQIAFAGALMFGLIHLVLSDHPGPFSRRDWFGLGAGLAALMCSNVGLAMLVAVGVAVLIARGWRIAALHTVPLAAVYALWATHFHAYSGTGFGRIASVFDFVRIGTGATFGALGQVSIVAWVLGVVLIVGLVLAWMDAPTPGAHKRLAGPVGLLVAAGAFLFMTGYARVGLSGVNYARSGRYVHVAAAMVLPAIAFAADALARRWRVAFVIMLALLLIGIPGNIDKARDFHVYRRGTNSPAALRQLVEAIPRSALAATTPRSLVVDPLFAWDATIGWLRDGVRAGRISAPRPSTQVERSDIDLRLSLMQRIGSTRARCVPLRSPVILHLRRGDFVDIRNGAVRVQDLSPTNGVKSPPLVFGTTVLTPPGDHLLVALARPMTILMRRTVAAPASLCYARPAR